MYRNKKNRWTLIVLIALISSFAFCSGAYAQEQNKEIKAQSLEKLYRGGSGDISWEEHKVGKQAIMDINRDGSVSKEERKIYKQNSKERKKKIKEARKARKKARMDTDKDGSVSKEERKIYKQNRKEAKKKIKEARKVRKKAIMDTDKDGSVSKEMRK
jgi:uncharacterized membrane protein